MKTAHIRSLTAALAHTGGLSVATQPAAHSSPLIERLRLVHGVTDAQIQRCIAIAQQTLERNTDWLWWLLETAQRGEDIDAWLEEKAKAWGVQ